MIIEKIINEQTINETDRRIQMSNLKNYLHGFFYAYLGVAVLSLIVIPEDPISWSKWLLFHSLIFFVITLFFMKRSSTKDVDLQNLKTAYDIESSFMSECVSIKHKIESRIQRIKEKPKEKEQKAALEILLERYHEKIIGPRKKKGKNAMVFEKDKFEFFPEDRLPDDYDIDNMFRDFKEDEEEPGGIEGSAKNLETLRSEVGRSVSMPMLFSGFIGLMFLLLSICGFLDNSYYDNYHNEFHFGVFYHWTTAFGIIAFTGVAIYLVSCFKPVEPTQQALKFIFKKPFGVVDRGYRFVFRWFSYLKPFPKPIQYLDIKPDSSELTGANAQSVSIDISTAYKYVDLVKVLDGLGDDFDSVRKKLEGPLVEKGKEKGKINRGMIDDKITGLVRGFIADLVDDSVVNKKDEGLYILDTLLKSREKLEIFLQTKMNEYFKHLGIHFDRPVITDIAPDALVKTERNTRAVERIKVETEKIKAEGAKHTAKQTSEKAKGDAQAGLIKFKKNVEAIKYLENKGHAKEALPLISALLLAEKSIAEIAPALAGMNINLYQIPGIDEILQLVGGFTKNLSDTKKV